MKRLLASCLTLALLQGTGLAQQTDLSGLKFCIDPGHGGHNSNDRWLIPDPGVNFYESESNFQKALWLRAMLEEQGAAVILTRTSNDTTYPAYLTDGDLDEPSLSARVEIANANSATWFHSIHSNAYNGVTNYTLMLVREKRPGGPYSGSGNGYGVPETPEALAMAKIMSPAIQAVDRTGSNMTYLDWTFYGGTNGGFSLGVLRGLAMPGELSEGSMHDVPAETRRLMNNDYRKVEAYALRNAIMQYFGVPADQHAIVAGIQTDVMNARPVNGTRVRLFPPGRVYEGDAYNNGYYLFDSLSAGTYTIRFETPLYAEDSVVVTLVPGTVTFVDRTLEAAGPPRVVAVTPAAGDTLVMPNVQLQVSFSKPMDTASVLSGFTLSPPVQGEASWNALRTVLSFTPDTSFAYRTSYIATVEGTAHATTGELLDGNADGAGGDPFSFSFRTRYYDVMPPRLLARYPDSGSVGVSSQDVIALLFDERLDQSTVIPASVLVQKNLGGIVGIVQRTLQYWEGSGRSGVNVYVQNGLEPGAEYRVRMSGFKDMNGNTIGATAYPIWSFKVAPDVVKSTVVLDSLSGTGQPWLDPGFSGSTTGIDSARFSLAGSGGIGALPAGGCAALQFAWSASANPATALIRELPPAGPARTATFSPSGHALQAYVRGDGSGTRFRFAVADSVDAFPGGRVENHEVSQWVPLDWVGWRLVQWDFEHDPVGAWIGNGKLEGLLRFDSFQLAEGRHVSAAGDTTYGPAQGQIMFQQLQVVQFGTSGVPGRAAPASPETYALEQNYPNPFNPSTTIAAEWPVASRVKLSVYDLLGREVAVLLDGVMPAGRRTVHWDAGTGLCAPCPSGVYFYRLEASPADGSGKAFLATRRMILVK